MEVSSEGALRTVDELWLDIVQRIAGRAAHEMKGALNGVAVNLEVIRSQALGGSVTVESYSRFAETAAGQLEAVIGMSEALLALAREGRSPPEVAAVAAQVAALLEPVARARGTRFSLQVGGGGSTSSGAPVAAVRAAIGGAMLAAAEAESDIECICEGGAGGPRMSIVVPFEGAGLSAELSAAIGEHGIQVKTDGHGISMTFPGYRGNSTEGL